jgi:GNAT superfamily N-acetyltransferase
MDPRDAMRAGELAEATYMREFSQRADQESRTALGLATATIGGGVVSVMAHDPTPGFWNRTIGLGLDEPVTAGVVDEVLTFVREQGGRLTIFQVAPGAAPAGWEEVLSAAGAQPMSAWVKFVGDRVEPPAVTTDLRVERLTAEHGAEFAQVMCVGFGMPTDGPLPGWFAQMPSWDDGFRAYGAFDGHTMVAASSLVVDGELASLCGAATLPEHRGRGAQGALMARRIDEARSLGARYVVTETGAETPDSPNPSLHNMRRMGLSEVYERRNWVWFAPRD